jgi:CMP-N-acetylneuraminic acid synthetase
MKRDIGFFLPVRKGSQRVENKNTRPFSKIPGGILELKLRQLMESKTLSEIVLSTNDENSMEIAKKLDPQQTQLRIIERPNHLCLDTTPLMELIAYVPEVMQSRHILWGHTTTPFIDAEDYDEGIENYFAKLELGFDSLISVMPLQNFLLDKNGHSFNYDVDKNLWPRTQDLPVLYEVNHAMFIASRDIYVKNKNRIGVKPFMYEQDKIKSFDIDWEDDFLMAEAIYEKLVRV